MNSTDDNISMILTYFREEISTFHKDFTTLNFKFSTFLKNSRKPSSLLLYFEIIVYLIGLTANIVYISYGQFYPEMLRFLYLAALLVSLVLSLKKTGYDAKLDFSVRYKNFLLLRLPLMSHYYQFIGLLFNDDIEYSIVKELHFEIKIFLFHWTPMLVIQICSNLIVET